MSRLPDDPIKPLDDSEDELLPDSDPKDNESVLENELDMDDLVHSRRLGNPNEGKTMDPDEEVHNRPSPKSSKPPVDPDDAVHGGL